MRDGGNVHHLQRFPAASLQWANRWAWAAPGYRGWSLSVHSNRCHVVRVTPPGSSVPAFEVVPVNGRAVLFHHYGPGEQCAVGTFDCLEDALMEVCPADTAVIGAMAGGAQAAG